MQQRACAWAGELSHLCSCLSPGDSHIQLQILYSSTGGAACAPRLQVPKETGAPVSSHVSEVKPVLGSNRALSMSEWKALMNGPSIKNQTPLFEVAADTLKRCAA